MRGCCFEIQSFRKEGLVMETMIQRVNRLVAACNCGQQHNPVTLDEIVVEAGAIAQIPAYIKENGYRHIALVADSKTYEAAGRGVEELLTKAGILNRLVLAQPNVMGDVVADEQTIVQVMLEIDSEMSDLVLVTGAGTVHDIARLIAFKMNKPFLSVPTAPSVDGFNSKGAPIIIKGEKITIPASSPVAIFADLDILAKAPPRMIAAGFGDMLGKFTSLFDWVYGHRTAGERYCQAAYQITESALKNCVEHVQQIGKREREGIRILMNGLIESGLAMLIFGQSYSGSGSEHHMSHYWEMEYIRLGRKQLLHGAKVGAACAEISSLYRRIAGDSLMELDEQTKQKIEEIPSPDQLRGWLRTAGGATTPEELGITPDLLTRSLNEAHHVRKNRNTLLKSYNESRA
jgi:glycerol-1-phosphate dehydrogenase [NAD(P)+]